MKLGLTDPAACQVFDEKDGTEIDDDECLAEYEKGSVFIIGKEWKPVGLEDKGDSETINDTADRTTLDIGQELVESEDKSGSELTAAQATRDIMEDPTTLDITWMDEGDTISSEEVSGKIGVDSSPMTEGFDFGATSSQHMETVVVEDEREEERQGDKAQRGQKRTLIEMLLESDFKKKTTNGNYFLLNAILLMPFFCSYGCK